MRKLLYTLFLLLPFLLLSCKGDEEDIIKDGPKPAPPALRLSKATTTFNGFEEFYVHTYAYGEKGELTEYRRKTKDTDLEIRHVYDGQGRLTNTAFHENHLTPTLGREQRYTHDASGRVTYRLETNFWRAPSPATYHYGASPVYDTQGRLVRLNRFQQKFTPESPDVLGGWGTYEYDSRGNLTDLRDYSLISGQERYNYHIQVQYDDKPNPFFNLGASFVAGYGQVVVDVPSQYITALSPNNPVRVVKTFHTGSGQVFTYDFAYKYGAGGLPTELTKEGDAVPTTVQTLEYTEK